MQERGGTPLARSKLALFGLAAAVVAADQISKAWAVGALGGGRRIGLVGDTMDLRLVLNPGGSFGMFPGATGIIAALSLAVTAGVIVWAWRDPAAPLALGLVIGGGLGNLVDRAFRPPSFGTGHVVDFIYLSFWPTFNVADAAISVGVALILLQAIRE